MYIYRFRKKKKSLCQSLYLGSGRHHNRIIDSYHGIHIISYHGIRMIGYVIDIDCLMYYQCRYHLNIKQNIMRNIINYICFINFVSIPIIEMLYTNTTNTSISVY